MRRRFVNWLVLSVNIFSLRAATSPQYNLISEAKRKCIKHYVTPIMLNARKKTSSRRDSNSLMRIRAEDPQNCLRITYYEFANLAHTFPSSPRIPAHIASHLGPQIICAHKVSEGQYQFRIRSVKHVPQAHFFSNTARSSNKQTNVWLQFVLTASVDSATYMDHTLS